MLRRQRGISLVKVFIFSGLVGLAAMAALFSMRYDRNLFAEMWGKATSTLPTKAVVDAAQPAPAPLRKCIINGKTVVSNTDCTDDNKTSKTIAIHDTRGIEAPKKPAEPAEAERRSDPMIDKMIEKQLR